MAGAGGPMRDFLTRHREGLLLACLLVASLLIISQQVEDRTGMTYLKKWAIAIMAPFQSGASQVTGVFSGIWHDYFYLFDVREDNYKLRSEANRLRSEVQILKEELYRVGNLARYSRYQEETGLQGISARVIGESPDPWTRLIIINRGRDNGIASGMPVTTPEGLVGRVVETSFSSSVVRLIVDRSSRVPVLVSRSRARAIMEGENSGTCQMKHLDRTEDVQEGDTVITSGLAGVYPRGIEVGTITQVLKENYGLYQYAKLLPKAPIARLEDVFVLTGSNTEEDAE